MYEERRKVLSGATSDDDVIVVKNLVKVQIQAGVQTVAESL